jgi:PKD domain/Divergent InlB B-repeat domain/Fibronectin type III domain
MRKNPARKSGALNPRVFIAITLSSAAALVSLLSFAQAPTPGPSPSSGTLSVSHPKLAYTDSVGPAPNATGEGVGFSAPTCAANGVDCSTYTLTLDPSIFTASGNYDPSKNSVVVQLSWSPAVNQYGSFVEDKNGNVIASNTAGLDPETITIPVQTAGLSSAGPLTIVTTLEVGAPGSGYTGTVSLVAASGSVSASASPAPRYQIYVNPNVQTSNSGLEPSIGVDYNPNVASLQKTAPGTASVGPTLLNTGGLAMFTETFDQYQVGFDDCSSPAINTWTNTAFIVQQTTTLDAIGFTDHFTTAPLGIAYPPPKTPGRTFLGELTAGDSNMSYTDDDGATHTQTQGGGIPQGPDHETVGGGPYNPNSVPPPPPNAVYPNAIYYCTQNIVAEAECSRSDDGGLTFGPGVPIYQNVQGCIGSIHGHVKVARDGTVYVPNYSCTLPNGNQGVAVSTDNGITWTERNVTGSGSPKPGLVDPSVGIGLNDVGKPAGQTTNTIYFGYIDSDGSPKIARSHDSGVTWSTPQNVGAAFNIANSTFPVVVAGDDDRAAFGFLGTPTIGNSSTDPNFAGVWHLYIATTYDGGNSWVTIDATPDNPVQVGPVCNAGTTCSTPRNLLDFNGFDVDSQGRGLVGFTTGCLGCTNTSPASASTGAQATVARQSGGPRLFSKFDPVEPTRPANPQAVSAEKQGSPAGVLVSWLEPDDGGSPITSYNIYRGTSSGAETLLASVSNSPTNTHTKYLDTTATGSTYFYHVTAVNAKGASGFCEELSVGSISGCPLGQGSPCQSPYVLVGCAGGPGNVPTDPTSGELTIQGVDIGEPFTNCTDNSLTMVMNVQTLDPTGTKNTVLPANSEWQILFGVTDTNGKPETVYVDINTITPNTPASPGVDIGRRDPTTTGTLDSPVCTASATSTCPQITATTSPGGVITFKLNVASPISFGAPTGATGVAFNWDASKPGTQLNAIEGNTFLLAGAGAGFLETIETTGAKGTYTRVGNLSCSDKLPIAVLSANPNTGNAPLTVNFDASASNEPTGACGTINSYTLDFGDGSAPVTQSSPTFVHTYNNPGSYPARLTVGDTVGQVSNNPAQQVITVNSSQPAIQITVQTNPAGLSYTVDNVVFDTTQTFSWPSGTSHTIATTSPQAGGTGTQYAFKGWSDGGAKSHSVAPTRKTTYTASFGTQYFLTMNNGSGGSSVSPASGWKNKGSIVSISAKPANGFAFSNWAGSGLGSYSGTNNPGSITMNAPITETANFVTGPAASVTASPTQVPEGQTATYTISLPQAPSQPVTVHYKMSGTASRGTGTGADYNLGGTFGQVTIPAGQSSATVTLTSNQDSDEGNEPKQGETAIMTLAPGPSYSIGSPSSATVLITP